MGLVWGDTPKKGNLNMTATFQSRNWGEGNFRQRSKHSFEGIVQQLPPNVKQAMYAAVNRGTIKRGTWNGCAFNAGSIEICHDEEKSVKSVEAAARFFNISTELVSRFIRLWDNLPGSTVEANERLKNAILDAGLFSEPNEPRGKRVLRQTVYKSEETRMREEFEALVENLDLNASAEEDQLAYATSEMRVLLAQ